MLNSEHLHIELLLFIEIGFRRSLVKVPEKLLKVVQIIC